MTTNKTISRSQISALRDEAAAYGDTAMVVTCDLALTDLRHIPSQRETAAVRTCADVIADTEAQAASAEPTESVGQKEKSCTKFIQV